MMCPVDEVASHANCEDEKLKEASDLQLWNEVDPRPFAEKKAAAVAFFQTLALLCCLTPSRDEAN